MQHIRSMSEFVGAVAAKALQEVGDEWGVKGIKTPKDIERYGKWLGAENFILQGADRTNYELQTLDIKDILAKDKIVAERITKTLDKAYNHKNVNLPIIINKLGKVIDGYHRLQTKIKAKELTIHAYVGVS